ncbi:MAG: hypothetical protein MIO93_04075 [ANME-2 cluster archaeon]|jgi:hypothetical protein|nr:hypothetical protein [ANME-2 cluster archaeon]
MLDFNYDTSIFNPALKIDIALIYIFVILLYYKAYKAFEGALNKDLLKILLFVGVFGFLSALTSCFGHGTEFGFNDEFSLKWFESLFYIVQASLFIYGGYKLNMSTKK